MVYNLIFKNPLGDFFFFFPQLCQSIVFFFSMYKALNEFFEK
jgi:hypothetical protein